MTDTKRLMRQSQDRITGADLLATWSERLGGNVGMSLNEFLKWLKENGGFNQILAEVEKARDEAVAAAELSDAFQTRAQAQAALIPASIDTIRVIHNNLLLDYRRQPGGTALVTQAGDTWSPLGVPRPEHWGAVVDGVTDDSAAMNAWMIYSNALATVMPQIIRGPSGRVLMASPLRSILPAAGSFRRTFDFSATEFICDFNRSAYPAFIELGDRLNPSVYQGQYDFAGRVLLRRGPNCTYAPVGIEAWGMAQSQMAQIDTSSWNNSLLVTHGAQNVTFRDLIFYSGGWCFGFRDPAGMNVTWGAAGVVDIVPGSTSVTFDASWLGKLLSLHTTESAYHVKITAINSPTQVVVDTLNPITGTESYTAPRIVRTGSPAVTTTAGSAVVVIDGEEAVGDHLIGLLVAIPRAGADGKILIAKIIATNSGARTVTLDRNASVTLNPGLNPATDTTEISTPVVATLSDVDTGIYSNGVSQVRFFNTQFETFRGLVMLFDDAELVDFFGCKFHGVQTGYAWNLHAVGAIWGNRLGGKFYGECDARYYGQFRFRFATQTQSFTFHHLAGRMATFEKLVHTAPMLSGFEAAVAAFGVVSLLGCFDGAEFSTLATDENVTFAGYNPPSTFIKPDRDDIKHYCGPLNVFSRSGAFSLANGKLTYDPVADVLQSNGKLRVNGQGATIEIRDSDNSGFTGLEFRNNGNALRGWLRHTTSDGTMDLMIDADQLITFGPSQITARKNFRLLGQTATLDIWDADDAGFTYINFSNNGGAARGSIRHTTSSGQMDMQVAGTTVASFGAGVGFYGTAPIAKQTGVAVTAAAIHAALVNLGLIGA